MTGNLTVSGGYTEIKTLNGSVTNNGGTVVTDTINQNAGTCVVTLNGGSTITRSATPSAQVTISAQSTIGGTWIGAIGTTANFNFTSNVTLYLNGGTVLFTSSNTTGTAITGTGNLKVLGHAISDSVLGGSVTLVAGTFTTNSNL
jgi:hypothetical protein